MREIGLNLKKKKRDRRRRLTSSVHQRGFLPIAVEDERKEQKRNSPHFELECRFFFRRVLQARYFRTCADR